MIQITKHDTGAAVEDVQRRLFGLGYLPETAVSGIFDDATESAVSSFCTDHAIAARGSVDDEVWAALVDASFSLGDRTLYLRMPYFHGNDVRELQMALSALGFECGVIDGIFGAYTELALRKFQMNMALPADGIAGALTFDALSRLQFSWAGKAVSHSTAYLGFARAADVLESRKLCLFGTDEFSRSVASRMSNLAMATNPASKVLSAESLLTPPTDDMLMVHLVLSADDVAGSMPVVQFDEEGAMPLHLRAAIDAAHETPERIAVVLPGTQWQDAGADRSAQHFAIALLDALCAALGPAE